MYTANKASAKGQRLSGTLYVYNHWFTRMKLLETLIEQLLLSKFHFRSVLKRSFKTSTISALPPKVLHSARFSPSSLTSHLRKPSIAVWLQYIPLEGIFLIYWQQHTHICHLQCFKDNRIYQKHLFLSWSSNSFNRFAYFSFNVWTASYTKLKTIMEQTLGDIHLRERVQFLPHHCSSFL